MGMQAREGLCPPELSPREISELNVEFEMKSASEIIQWAVDMFLPHLCLTTSMADAVLVDLAVNVAPSIEVVFIDTGYHFPETLQTLEFARRRYALNLRVMRVPPQPIELWKVDPEQCCSVAKVTELERALLEKRAWLSGLRRSDGPARTSTPIIGYGHGRIKINPLATWSDSDVTAYITAHNVPVNPLQAQGFLSIGCMPCTQPVARGGDARSGRWVGSDKTECGMHDMGVGAPPGPSACRSRALAESSCAP